MREDEDASTSVKDEDGSTPCHTTTSVKDEDASTTTSANHFASLLLSKDSLQDADFLPCSRGGGGGGDRKKERAAQDHEQQQQQHHERKRLQRKLALTPGLTRHKQQVARAKEVGDSVPPEATTALLQDLQDVVLSQLEQLEEAKELSESTQAEIKALFALKFRHAAPLPHPLVGQPQASSTDTDAAIEVLGEGLKVRLVSKMLTLEEQQARAQEEKPVEEGHGGMAPSLAARTGGSLSIDTSFQHEQPELKAAPTDQEAAPTHHKAASSKQRALLAVESVITLLEGMKIIAGPDRGRKAAEQRVCHTHPPPQVCHTHPPTPPPPSFKAEATGKTSERAEMLVLHTTALDAICSGVSRLETLALELGERGREREREREKLSGASHPCPPPRRSNQQALLLEQMRQVQGDIRDIALSFSEQHEQMHWMASQEKRAAAGGLDERAAGGLDERAVLKMCASSPAFAFQRIRRARVEAMLGEMVLGRERFLIHRLQPQRWMLARLTQTQFLEFLKRLAAETYMHPPDNQVVDDVVIVTQQRAEPNLGSKLKGITLGRARALTQEHVAKQEDIAELRSIFKTADPVTGAVGAKAPYCALPQLLSALFMHGLAFKAHKFSKVLSVVIVLYSKCAADSLCARTLTFENVLQGGFCAHGPCARQGAGRRDSC